ncbi:hypothetical protein M5D96_009398 [Drosophila gunungcola]|uniref:Uncharacterized protein n=1 Tax=Drosophila gunungcola TaxID=103775 RepID=A0A9Q0BMP9_9MUSC|nr:hypothetical protein M5D96_009398 [Drosophila gunungcola]
MRDGAYKFCFFFFFSEWSRNFCAVASGMQPNSGSNYKTHLAARHWRSAEGEHKGETQSWHSGGHNNHKQSADAWPTVTAKMPRLLQSSARNAGRTAFPLAFVCSPGPCRPLLWILVLPSPRRTPFSPGGFSVECTTNIVAG